MSMNNHALLIGVGQRDDEGAVFATTAVDAERVACELQKHCGYTNLTTVLKEEATTQNILNQLDNLIAKTEQKEADTVIVFFSGHGYSLKKDGGKSYYLICQDTEKSDISQTAISGKKFVKKLQAIKAKQLLVLLNCCHSGGVISSDLGVTKEIIPFPMDNLLKSSNRAVISASHESKVAYTGKPNSVFTYALVEGLSGKYFVGDDENVRLFDLAMYIRERVATLTKRKQKPQLDVLPQNATTNFTIVSYPNGKPTTYPCGREPLEFFDGNKSLALNLEEELIVDEEYRKGFGWLKINKINKVDVDGNNNLTIQDVEGSNITINYNDTEALMNLILKLNEQQTIELKKMVGEQHVAILKEVETAQGNIDQYNTEEKTEEVYQSLDDFWKEIHEIKIESLKELFLMNYKLLREFETLLVFEQNPMTISEYKYRVKQIKAKILELELELKSIKNNP